VLRVEELPRVRAYITVADKRRKPRDAALIRNIYAERSYLRARAVLLHVSQLAASKPDQVAQHSLVKNVT